MLLCCLCIFLVLQQAQGQPLLAPGRAVLRPVRGPRARLRRRRQRLLLLHRQHPARGHLLDEHIRRSGGPGAGDDTQIQSCCLKKKSDGRLIIGSQVFATRLGLNASSLRVLGSGSCSALIKVSFLTRYYSRSLNLLNGGHCPDGTFSTYERSKFSFKQ